MPGFNVQSRINPPVSNSNKTDFSAADVNNPTDIVSAPNPDKIDFKALINNSMDEIKKQRAAKESGDLTAGTEEEFLEKLAEQTKEKRAPKNQLGKDDFLKLFVTQLQNQDPLNPDDGTEMAAKLAQFNGLEQMMNVNKSLEKMLSDQNLSRNLQLVNYVGREVSIEGGRAKLTNGQVSKSEFSLEMPAAAVTLEVRDTSGLIVNQTDLGPMQAGTHPIKWDGKSNSGRVLGDGIYTYAINARNTDGNPIPAAMTAKARITGVDIKSTDGSLYSDFGKIKFDQIKSVGRPGYDSEQTEALPAQKSAGQTDAAIAQKNGSQTVEDLDRLKAQGKLSVGGVNQAQTPTGNTVNTASSQPVSSPSEKGNSAGTPAKSSDSVGSMSKDGASAPGLKKPIDSPPPNLTANRGSSDSSVNQSAPTM